MATVPSILAILTFLSSCVSAGVALHTWQHKDKPGAKTFAAVLVGATIWSFSYAVALNTFDPELRRLLEIPVWIGRVIMPMSWIVFALQYTGRGDLVTRPVVAVLLLNPVATIVITTIPSLHGLMWRDYHVAEVVGAATAAYGNGPWLVWQTLYGYFLIGTGLLILVEMLLSHVRLYRGQALTLIVSAAIPTTANVVWLFDLGPYPTIDLTPLAFSTTCMLMGYALFRQDLFGLIPATRRAGQRTAIDYFGDGVVVIDDQERIIDLNVKTETIFDCEAADVLGQPVDVLVEDGATDLTANNGLIEIDGLKFELTATPIRDYHDKVVGQTLMFHDVTERVQRKQLLSVLNRVLRHNLRNDMNVVQGCARTLKEHADNSQAELASRIEHRSTKLMELGNKAQDIERLIEEEELRISRFDVCERVRAIVDRLEEDNPDSDVTIHAPDELWLETDAQILDAILSNVVENALEHNDAARPEVEVTLSRTNGWIELTVADNGPGIPDQELDVLDAEEETPLEHGSGLGLWLVRWSITALNGDVTFEDNDPRGTVTQIRVPDASADHTPIEPAQS